MFFADLPLVKGLEHPTFNEDQRSKLPRLTKSDKGSR
jgi:hypothetical protein